MGEKRTLRLQVTIFLLVMNFSDGKSILRISFESIIKERLMPSGSIFIIARENAIIIIIP